MDLEKRSYWEEKIAGWRSSGVSQRTYCEREGIKWATFDYWRRRIQSKVVTTKPAGKTIPSMTLVPVQMTQAEAAPLVLHGPGGWRLMVPASVDAVWLAALMQSLA